MPQRDLWGTLETTVLARPVSVPRGAAIGRHRESDVREAHRPAISDLACLPEHTLLERARAGEREAFGELVRRYQDAIYNLCYRMLGNAADAADAAQEVFLKAYRGLARYDPRRRFSTWVLSIASHHCIDRLRRRRATWVSLDSPPAQRASAAAPHPEEEVLRREVQDAVQEALNTLPPEDRLILVLHYWHDLSYRDIASVVGLSENAVKVRAYRARQRLGKWLKERGWMP